MMYLLTTKMMTTTKSRLKLFSDPHVITNIGGKLVAVFITLLFVVLPTGAADDTGGDSKRSAQSFSLESLSDVVMEEVNFDKRPILDCIAEVRQAALRKDSRLPLVHFLTEEDKAKNISYKAKSVNVRNVLTDICKQADLTVDSHKYVAIVRSPSKSIPASPFRRDPKEDLVNALRATLVREIYVRNAILRDVGRYLNDNYLNSDIPESEDKYKLAVDRRAKKRQIDRIRLRDIAMYDVLRYVCAKTNTSLIYRPEEKMLIFADPSISPSEVRLRKETNDQEEWSEKILLIMPSGHGYRREGDEAGFLGEDRAPLTAESEAPQAFRLRFRLPRKALNFSYPEKGSSAVEVKWSGLNAEGDKGGSVPEQIELVPFADKKMIRIDFEPVDSVEGTKVPDSRPVADGGNWYLFDTVSSISEIKGGTTFFVFYKNEFGQKVLPEGEYMLTVSVRLKVTFEDGTEKHRTPKARRRIKFQSSDWNNPRFYRRWLYLVNSPRLPESSLKSLLGKGWLEQIVVDALNEVERRQIDLGRRTIARYNFRVGRYADTYETLKEFAENPSKLDQLGPRLRDDILRMMKKSSEKLDKPNLLKDYEYDSE